MSESKIPKYKRQGKPSSFCKFMSLDSCSPKETEGLCEPWNSSKWGPKCRAVKGGRAGDLNQHILPHFDSKIKSKEGITGDELRTFLKSLSGFEPRTKTDQKSFSPRNRKQQQQQPQPHKPVFVSPFLLSSPTESLISSDETTISQQPEITARDVERSFSKPFISETLLSQARQKRAPSSSQKESTQQELHDLINLFQRQGFSRAEPSKPWKPSKQGTQRRIPTNEGGLGSSTRAKPKGWEHFI